MGQRNNFFNTQFHRLHRVASAYNWDFYPGPEY